MDRANIQKYGVGILSLLLVMLNSSLAGQIIYVDDDAPPRGEGSSWVMAYCYLQDALAKAKSGDEVRVAEGVYKPDQGMGLAPGDRNQSFILINGVTVKGGYPGLGQSDPNTRNIKIYTSILSGDLNNDDEPYFQNIRENSYHVVTSEATSILDGFIITGGNADESYWTCSDGGGIWLFWGSLTLYNCIVCGNHASGNGGGISLEDSDVLLMNCLVIGNRALHNGGGIYSWTTDGDTFAIVINSTFYANTAENEAGGLYMERQKLTNCILWDNRDSNGNGQWSQLNGLTQYLEVDYSCIQGWTGELGGICNIGNNPMFVNADGVDNITGTEDDNLRLLGGSPCIDGGDNLFGIDPDDFTGPPVPCDLDGNPRILNGMVDMGAYEFRGLQVIYVDAGATGSNDGNSWADAYVELQSALDDADPDDEIWVAAGTYLPDYDPDSGTHTRDREATFQLVNGVAIYGGFPTGGGSWEDRDPNIHETILSGDLMGNDIEFTNPWDLFLDPTWGENSYHLVTGSGTDVTAVLDGFTITAGNANAVYQYDSNGFGGGMYCLQGSPKLTNCTFIHNLTLWKGSAMYNQESNPTLTNCNFTENATINLSGTMYNSESSPTLTGCTFIKNIASNTSIRTAGIYNRNLSSPTLSKCTFTDNSGHGMQNSSGCNPTLTNCTFRGNSGYGMGNWQGSPILTNCTFEENGSGGMDNSNNSNGILTNCTFTRNLATIEGAGIYNNDSSPTLINCTFSGNRAGRWGGGMSNHNLSSPTLTNCMFIGNWAGDWGGGMYNTGASPILTNCTFTGNTADEGGGIRNEVYSDAVLTNCTFKGNSAEEGGGISICYYSIPTFTSCSFTGNRAEKGGGIANCYGNSLALANCIFTGNSATEEGGAMYNYGCYQTAQAEITNCTFVENLALHGNALFCESCNQEYPSDLELTNCILWDGDNEISSTDGSKIVIAYSDVQGGWPGVGNIDAEPMFVQPGYRDANHTPDYTGDDLWVEGDYHLLAGSPCIDAGDNSAVPPSVLTDLDGNPRIVNGTVDMGAYEGPNQGFLLSTRSITISEGNTAAFTVALAMDPFGPVNVMIAIESGDPDISVDSPGTLTFDSSNFSVPQMVIVAAVQDGDNLNGSALVQISAADLPDAKVTACEQDDDPISDILFVDANATGQNNGSSWIDAYTDLQVALGVAHTHTNVEQIRVAQGVYRPVEPNGNRRISFKLINNVTLKGGYASVGALDPNERDFELYETILSGDLNGDDGPAFANNGENSYHVFYHPDGTDLDNTAILDGFTVSGGNANLGDISHAGNGGGMYNYDSSPTVNNCSFSGNFAIFSGGGMVNYYDSSPTIANCKFSGNSAHSGGGMLNWSGPYPTVTNCIFSNNYASYSGGGMFSASSSPIVTNCIFAGNSAGYYAGMEITDKLSFPVVTNCTFSGNSARRDGGAIGIRYSSSPTVTNCIFWGDTPEEIYVFNATPVITYCDVQGGWPGEGNIEADPLFVDHVSENYHLLPNSPCIDAGDDAGIYTDLEGNLRPFDYPGVDNNGELPEFDMGAYEFVSVEAQMKITPRTINCRSHGKWVKAHLVLPEGFDVSDVDASTPLRLEPLGFESDHLQVSTGGDGLVKVEARFKRSEFCAAAGDWPEKIIVFGSFTDGKTFYGTADVRIILPGLRKIAELSSNWLQTGCQKPHWCDGMDLNQDSVVNLMDFALLQNGCIEFENSPANP